MTRPLSFKMNSRRPIRVLLGKCGLDGHDRGIAVIARALRDAGMEVIYLGIHQTPEGVIRAAVEEDADVVAISILSGAHMTLFPAILEGLTSEGLKDCLLTGGGIIPEKDKKELNEMGVGRLFDPGSHSQEIIAYIQNWLMERERLREESVRLK